MAPRIPFNLHAGTGLLQFNHKTRQFVKRNAETGRFIDMIRDFTYIDDIAEFMKWCKSGKNPLR